MTVTMMPSVDVTSIEHLDHRLECRFAPCAVATHWAEAHGCEEGWLCTRHADRLRELGTRIMAKHGHITCAICERRFPSFEAYATVVPL